ncbi:hypothetical protein ABW20_dc0107835 [Dactylellina cionopaga]|nr:hypothetical protein ABW20_dc0107835 [Dactylellina cionopaga]
MCRHLKVPTGQKIAVLAIFSVGALVCVFSGLRFFYLRDYWNSDDPTWVAFNVSAMSTLEANVAIITSSVPAIKPLITYLFPNSKFLKTWCESAADTLGRSARYGGGSGENDTTKDIDKLALKRGSNAAPFPHDSYSTTMVGSTAGCSGRELSESDLGFPDGIDGKFGPPPDNWDMPTPPAAIFTSATTSEIPRGRQQSNDMGWIDREISMAADGMDIESFKRGNMNAKMDLAEALRGGPVGIIPDPPGESRRQSEAPFPHLP